MDKLIEYRGRKSMCLCGHPGDGEVSMHEGAIGHGACAVPKCKCEKFTWSYFLPKYEKYLKLIAEANAIANFSIADKG